MWGSAKNHTVWAKQMTCGGRHHTCDMDNISYLNTNKAQPSTVSSHSSPPERRASLPGYTRIPLRQNTYDQFTKYDYI